LIEGGVDSTLFENFIYHTLHSIRTDSELASKKVVLLLDNARIHKSNQVLETARKMKVIVVFNAEYSPWLNPVEQFFGFLKSKLRASNVATK
jgi:transposase